MVDAKPPPTPGTPPVAAAATAFAGERSKIKLFMERTPSIGALKSKFLTVLGNSNELLNGISNKLTLSSSSSDSDYCDDDDEDLPKFDETIDYTKIDFEARRVKARRAHEEIISGRYRQPNLAPRPRLEHTRGRNAHKTGAGGGALRDSTPSSSSTSSSDDSSSISLPGQVGARSHISSTTRSNSIESRHSGGYERPRAIAGARRSELDMQKDTQRIHEVLEAPPHIDVQPPTDGERGGGGGGGGGAGLTQLRQLWGNSSNSMRVPTRSRTSNSSTLTSLRDEPDQQLASPSMDSTDWRNFIRSESQNSVPSWASSISLDCRAGEEPVKEFMKHFTELLFNNCAAVDLELKSEFGVLVRLEMGRQWFTRFLSDQRSKSKRLNVLTFQALAQYFALTLFECGESEDYAPAAVLMNLCFLFYHEVEVPGSEPYREYLFISLRQQPIWQQLRFWNATFHDSLQSEREHRHSARLRRQERRQQKQKQRDEATGAGAGAGAGDISLAKSMRKQAADSSSSSSHHSNAAVQTNAKEMRKQSKASICPQAAKDQEDIAFRQLGAFTCNMHSLGTTQELSLEFLKKHVVALNLSKDKAKLIRDNIYRMYHETELWGAK
ncbi:uncharacterized protein KIAA0513 [Scaptodrosophila lebanonensis]|uniref:Uncharacterized protein KIAA0513 n=1 Tax=Drosophila lebanonensis TaxID=7225 RepID=A0A6J2TXC5_DROLE|nr:uncharacterized protein KIAA0513 [Scaptodrosophila lebanonensis]